MHFSKQFAQLMTVCQSSVCVGMLFNWLGSVVLPPLPSKCQAVNLSPTKSQFVLRPCLPSSRLCWSFPNSWLTLIHDWERYLEESSSTFTMDEWCAASSLWIFSRIGAFCTSLQKLKGAVIKMNNTPCTHPTNISSFFFFNLLCVLIQYLWQLKNKRRF